MAKVTVWHKQDSWVIEVHPNSNWGNSPNLDVGGQQGGYIWTLIKYDLPDLDPAVTINSAKMRLYHYGNSYTPPDPITINAHEILEDWDESTVTWNNQPSHSSDVVGSITKSPKEYGWWEIGITSLVKKWISKESPNYGVKLIAPEATEGSVIFSSKENDLYDKSRLVIDYNKIVTEVSLNADKTEVVVGSSVLLYGQLTRTDTGLGISGETVKLQELVNGTWTDRATTTTGADGGFQFDVSFNTVGTYQFRVVYEGSLSFETSTSDTLTINVVKIPTQLEVVADKTTLFVTQTVNFVGTLRRSDDLTGIEGETVTLQQEVDGSWVDKQSKVTEAGGSFAFSVTLSEAGSYNFRVIYSGSPIYEACVSDTISITVNKFPTSLSLIPDKLSAVVDEIVNFKGFLENAETNEGIGGQTVELQQLISGQWTTVLTGTTEADGSVTLSKAMPSVGDIAFRLVFEGTDLYEPSTSDTVTISVSKIPTSITFTAEKLQAYVGELIHLFGSLVRTDTGEPIAGQQIELQQQVDTEWTTVQTTETDANGSFDFPVTFDVEGTFSFKAVFRGTEKHESVESNTIDITSIMPVIPTILTMVASSQTGRVGESITFSGELKTEALEPIADAEIVLEQQIGTEWVEVGTGRTNPSGFYSITKTFTEEGTFTFRTAFRGADPYGPSNSIPTTITVLSAVPYKRAPSRIMQRLDVDKTEVSVGTSIKIWGNLTFIAPLRAIPIPLQRVIIYKNGEAIAQTRTNITGAFETEWTPKEAGTYDLYASAYTRILGIKLAESNHIIINVSTSIG